MSGKLIKHMLEEWHSGTEDPFATAIELKIDDNTGFIGVAGNICRASGHFN